MSHAFFDALTRAQIETRLVNRVANDEHVINADPKHQDRQDGPKVAILPSSHIADRFSAAAGKKNAKNADNSQGESAVDRATRAQEDATVDKNEQTGDDSELDVALHQAHYLTIPSILVVPEHAHMLSSLIKAVESLSEVLVPAIEEVIANWQLVGEGVLE